MLLPFAAQVLPAISPARSIDPYQPEFKAVHYSEGDANAAANTVFVSAPRRTFHPPQELGMTAFRWFPLAASLFAAGTLIACNTAPSMPMGSASAPGMASPGQMGKMDAQMKKMREMHDKMAAAKTPDERSKLMAEHLKTMQDGMQMMGGISGMNGMPGPGMGDMKDMPAHHSMMDKRMAMMETMMQMMMDRMPAQPAR
jgi:hypothetical protein